MELALTWPAPAAAHLAVIGDVRVGWGALVPHPDDAARWRERAVAQALPAGAAVEVVAVDAQPTATGWPCDLVHAVVRVDGRVVQVRLAACYRFLEYAGVALAVAPDAAALDAARPVLLAAFATGRPDWAAGGTVVCLRQVLG